MLQEERFLKIIEYLHKNGTGTLQNLAAATCASVGTIRRDLHTLERNGLLKTVRGGAVAKSYNLARQTFDIRLIDHKEEKGSLSSALGSLIHEGQVIALNGGTTHLEVARYLASHYSQLTILTNNLGILRILEPVPSFNVIVPGGTLDHEEYTVSGRRCEESIRSYSIDTALLAVNAISLDRGITDFRLREVGFIQTLLAHTKQSIVVADHSKFDRIACVNVCGLQEIDGIVSDSQIPQDLLQRYTDAGVKIIIPGD